MPADRRFRRRGSQLPAGLDFGKHCRQRPGQFAARQLMSQRAGHRRREARRATVARWCSRSSNCHHISLLQTRANAGSARAHATASIACRTPGVQLPTDILARSVSEGSAVSASQCSICAGASVANSRARRGRASANFSSQSNRGSSEREPAVPHSKAPLAFFRLPANFSANCRASERIATDRADAAASVSSRRPHRRAIMPPHAPGAESCQNPSAAKRPMRLGVGRVW